MKDVLIFQMWLCLCSHIHVEIQCYKQFKPSQFRINANDTDASVANVVVKMSSTFRAFKTDGLTGTSYQ